MSERDVQYPWGIREDESAKAFAAFCSYRDLGVERSLDKAMEASNVKSTNRGHWGKWMGRFKWVERARSYDLHLDEIQRKKAEQRRKEMSERHISISKLFQQKVLERMQELKSEKLTPGDIQKWIETAVKIERQAMGEPTDIVRVTDPDTVTPEQVEEMCRAVLMTREVRKTIKKNHK